MGYFIGISRPQETIKNKKRTRAFYDYSFDAKEICVKAFRFIYGIGVTRLENIRYHLSVNDIKTRIHKATGKPNNRTILFLTIIKVISFILSYANRWSLPSPGTVIIIIYNNFEFFYLY